MTASDPAAAQQALEQAKRALRTRNRIDARHWATLAARLDPTIEEPWLILAAVGSPDASIAYLQRALEINPRSQRARKGMEWAFNRRKSAETTQKIPVIADTQRVVVQRPPNSLLSDTAKIPVQPKRKPVLPARARRSRTRSPWIYLGLPTLAVFLVFSLALIFWIGFSQNWVVFAGGFSVPHPVGMVMKPSLTATQTATSTTTFTSTPTKTATPTRTPRPTRKPTLKPTKTRVPPIVQAQPPNNVQIPVDPQGNERWIDVNLSSQSVSAYEGGQVLKNFIVSTGTYLHPTVTGRYHIYVKYRYTDMRGPGYYLPNVPYTMYFYQGYGLHGTYWHHNFGTPMSHGCVNLRTSDAAWLYGWASVGTLVNIHY
jgi:lipoprotein-anchoring transpeptidase ErfK/SrfK